jgi:G6PDH family F420-dependent oxidoreductase
MAKPLISLDIGENHYDPIQFVEAAVQGEELGFKRLWFGDHYAPWYHSSDRASFVWSVMASALDRTKKLELGPLVTVPIGARYHPALVAQASATLDNMYPGRFLISVGSGEAVNEVPFWNDRWPAWSERMERLCEGLTFMDKLFKEKKPFVFEGKYFKSEFNLLYTKPRTHMDIYFSAVGPKASYFAGKYGDHLVTLSPGNSADRIRDVLWPQFKKGQKDAKKSGGKLCVHVDFAFKPPAQVLKESRKELTPFVENAVDIKNPIALEEATKTLTVERLSRYTHICKNWNDLVKKLDAYVEIGASEIMLFSAPVKKEMEAVAKNVLEVF